MPDRILIIDDNRSIHVDFRKILELESQNTELDELETLLLGKQESKSSDLSADDSRSSQEYLISSAYQGEDGLQLIKESLEQNDPFVMAFVDMRMPPGWDGFQTIEQIWKVDPALQIVICTAYSDHSWTEMKERFPNEHRLLVLKKPFDVVEVGQLASALSQKWHSEQTTKTTLQNLEETVDSRTSEIRRELEERQKMEAALRASEQEFAAIFETATDGIIIINEQGEIVRSNSAIRRMTGKSEQHLTGEDFVSLLKDSQERAGAEILHDLLGNAGDKSSQEFDLRGNKDKVVPVAVTTSEFNVADLRRFSVTLRDRSDQKKMQQELYQAQKLESIGQLAAGIAHEINTPMQCVSGNVEFLRNCYERLFTVLDHYQEYLEGAHQSWEERKSTMDRLKQECRYDHIREQAPPAIEEAADAVRKVIEIVRAMKAMSHPGTQEKVPTDINDLIRSASTISRNRWKFVAQLALSLDPELPEVHALPAEISQVMLNLIVNAADAVLDKVGQDETGEGRITIRTRKHNEGVLIQVEDTGTGIPEDVKQRIFDPFFTTKQVGKGTGQGLAISYDAVVNRHGGSISADSVPGEGTTFSIWLPLKEACSPDCEPEGTVASAGELVSVN